MPSRRALMAALLVVVSLSGRAAVPAAATDEPGYYLPAPAGHVLVVAQGNGVDEGRVADERYAFDFVAADPAQPFDVVAARGGTVIGARSGVSGGRCDEPLDGPRPACWRDLNYVLIDHGDGTSALYAHLKRGALGVRIGEVVSAGQPIGSAGISGWTNHVGLGFQVQRTPTWDEWGGGGWFLTESLPIVFSDPDVVAQPAHGLPSTGDTVVSGNPGPAYEPFRFDSRPTALPASVPLEAGLELEVSAAYEADAADGYGLHFSGPTQLPVDVRPLFGGELEFAGCATGDSADLGRTVAIRFDVDGTPYLALHSHLSSIEAALLEPDASVAPPIIGPADAIGRYGPADLIEPDGLGDCPGVEAVPRDLFVTILRGGQVTPEGEVIGGTPVSPEPLVGERGYEGFGWWPGPVVAAGVTVGAGRPTVRWNARTPASGTHIRFGAPVPLRVRVRDVADIAEVRFRAWYPRWPRVETSRKLASFDPDAAWRQLAACRAPDGDQLGFSSLCEWSGDMQDAKVTYVWDASMAKAQPSAPWLPQARPAMSRGQRACVPVSLAVEVIDKAGHVHSDVARMPLPASCDSATSETVADARVLYLDPLVPPRAPTARGPIRDRGWPPVYEKDPLQGAIVWRDRSDNEDGFRIYARRRWFEVDCSVTNGPWQLVTTVDPNKQRYRPSHNKVQKSIPVPRIEGVPGSMTSWEYAVSAYNAAGETDKARVGRFLGGSEAFCDDGGLVPPPELER